MPRLDMRGGAPKRIAVFRALQLGDMLCAVPALRALRDAHPSSTITLIGLPWAVQFARRFHHLIDGFVEFPGYPGLPERAPDRAAWSPFVRAARQARLDVAIQMHGSGEITNALVRGLGASTCVGFAPRDARVDDATRWLRWPERGTEVERCLALTDFLHIPRRGSELEFPIAPEEYAAAHALANAHRLEPRAFVCIHPGARLLSRRWPAERFAQIARLAVDSGYRVVVTGTADEADICASVARGGGAAALDLCGRTPLGVLAALVSMARLVVCNDTGVSHVAAALGVPSVVVSCGADAARFAPADHERHRVLHVQTQCRPCMYDRCPIGHPCATALDVDAVADAAFAQLADPDSRAARRAMPAARAFEGGVTPG
jgi:ADP-heptose:LPS heptosyltransferase